MNEPRPSRPAPLQDIAGLIAFVALCLGIAGIGGAITATSVGSWYQALAKPSFNPPDWAFAPVWTALYIMMGIAGWRIWRTAGFRGGRAALSAFAVQLALNLGWSFAFFGLRSIAAGLVEIAVLFLAIVVTAVLFWRLDRAAGLLFAPYIAWVAFAALLNTALWVLN